MDIGEIAQRAGVARSTVSYALSGKRPISQRTRDRIQAVMAEAEYVPNAAAQSLARGRSHMIGLAVPSVDGHLSDGQLRLVGAVAEAAVAVDHDVVLAPAGEHQASFERLVQQRRIDGMLLMETHIDDPRVHRLVRSRMPFVVIGRTTSTEGYDWVDVDYDSMVRRCVRHLVVRGRRRLALINRSARLLDLGYGPAVRAAAAFDQECADHGVVGRALACPDEVNGSASVVSRLREVLPDCDGVVTINEAALPTLMPSLRSAGWSVPGDVSVCGVAAANVAVGTVPTLSGCDVPLHELASTAVTALLGILNGDGTRSSVLLDPPLIDRDSTEWSDVATA